jgi:hypothetical protein
VSYKNHSETGLEPEPEPEVELEPQFGIAARGDRVVAKINIFGSATLTDTILFILNDELTRLLLRWEKAAPLLSCSWIVPG